MSAVLSLYVIAAKILLTFACRCHEKLDEPLFSHTISPLPHTYLKEADLPERWDWRNVNGTNFCSKVLTQQNPQVCGSCWAEAATGALSDRYAIATQNKLRVQLGLQNLLNFKKNITGGACTGGNSLKVQHTNTKTFALSNANRYVRPIDLFISMESLMILVLLSLESIGSMASPLQICMNSMKFKVICAFFVNGTATVSLFHVRTMTCTVQMNMARSLEFMKSKPKSLRVDQFLVH